MAWVPFSKTHLGSEVGNALDQHYPFKMRVITISSPFLAPQKIKTQALVTVLSLCKSSQLKLNRLSKSTDTLEVLHTPAVTNYLLIPSEFCQATFKRPHYHKKQLMP